MAAYTRSLLEPLVATIERQADQLVSQAETIGRQSAELERAASTIVTLNDENQALRAAQASPEPSRPLHRLWARLWPVVAVLLALVMAGALAWPR